MLRIYFKTALRSLVRNRSCTIINIAGMAVGIAVCIMIFLIIQFHTSFDNFHSKKNRIFRVLTEYRHAEATNTGRDVPFPLPEGVLTTFPQVEEVAPIWASHNDKLLIPDSNGTSQKAFKENKGVFFTGPSFFKMFDYPLLAGSYESLKDPNNVLLTREIADKYFGDWKKASGKTIILEAGGSVFSHGSDVLKVSGILADIPANTDFQLKLVVAFGTGITGYMLKNAGWNDRTNSDFGCFVLLPPGIQADNFNEQLKEFSSKRGSAANKEINIIQPLGEVHYDTQTGSYGNRTISRKLINVLWLIAGFILIIACVNFINLSTAQAVNRAKETGIRKVSGSSKSQLQVQFIIETSMVVICAVILGCIIAILTLPYISRLLEISLQAGILNIPGITLFLLILTFAVIILASFYPSVVLSRFNPVDALKNKITSTTANEISLRRGLVVFQFIIAQALIIGTLIIVNQMNKFMDQPLGFDKEAIINVPFRVDTAWFRKRDYLKQQLLSVSGVKVVSFSSNTPVEDADDIWSTLKFDHAIKEADFKAITKFADEEYLPAYKLELIAGRNLQPSGTTREFLVNESLIKSLGIINPDDILNKEISIWDDRIKCPVVGVLKDFNDRSFHNSIAPLLITTNGTMYSQAAIKLETTSLSSTLLSVKTIWEKTLPNFVYEYRFLDDKIAGFYKQESQLAQLYKIFSAIVIFLSCLGLYGLELFMAVQKTKETGVRKAMGARVVDIVYLFSKEFIVLIAIALAFSAPIAWYFMHSWLQDYAYRINLSWWHFAAGGLISMIIALATISYQAVKAALANPVNSLRSE